MVSSAKVLGRYTVNMHTHSIKGMRDISVQLICPASSISSRYLRQNRYSKKNSTSPTRIRSTSHCSVLLG